MSPPELTHMHVAGPDSEAEIYARAIAALGLHVHSLGFTTTWTCRHCAGFYAVSVTVATGDLLEHRGRMYQAILATAGKLAVAEHSCIETIDKCGHELPHLATDYTFPLPAPMPSLASFRAADLADSPASLMVPRVVMVTACARCPAFILQGSVDMTKAEEARVIAKCLPLVRAKARKDRNLSTVAEFADLGV